MGHNKKSQSQKLALTCDFSGAPGPIRTADTRFRRAVLYPLSYGGAQESIARITYAYFFSLSRSRKVLLIRLSVMDAARCSWFLRIGRTLTQS